MRRVLFVTESYSAPGCGRQTIFECLEGFTCFLFPFYHQATAYLGDRGHFKLKNKLKIALFTHKITSGQANFPAIFSRTLTLASEVHSYNTRFVTSLNFYRPRVNNNYGAATFSFVASKLWETIPSDLKILSYTHFYKQYKLYLLNAQSVS